MTSPASVHTGMKQGGNGRNISICFIMFVCTIYMHAHANSSPSALIFHLLHKQQDTKIHASRRLDTDVLARWIADVLVPTCAWALQCKKHLRQQLHLPLHLSLKSSSLNPFWNPQSACIPNMCLMLMAVWISIAAICVTCLIDIRHTFNIDDLCLLSLNSWSQSMCRVQQVS